MNTLPYNSGETQDLSVENNLLKGAFGGGGRRSRQKDYKSEGPEVGTGFTCLKVGSERDVFRAQCGKAGRGQLM